MITRSTLLSQKEKLYDKVLGSLSALAIGDSLGDIARKADLAPHFGITTDFHKANTWSTDDTEFAMLCAKTLIDCNGNLTSADVVKAWLENVAIQDEFKRGGFSEDEAAKNLRKGLRPPLSGKYNAYCTSDGAAMRIAPIGLYCAGDPEKAVHMATIESEISHHGDGVWGALAVAAAVSVAAVDGSYDEILDAAVNAVPKDSWMYAAIQKAFEIIDQAEGNWINAWMPLHNQLWTSYWGCAVEAVAESLAVLKLFKSDFKTTLVYACNFGRDADTIGAIVGSILGAKFGAGAIPEDWIRRTRYTTGTCLTFSKNLDIQDIAQKLCAVIR